MSDEINGRPAVREFLDAVDRCARGGLLRSDSVDGAVNQELLGVGAVPGDQDRAFVLFDDDTDVARGVARQRHGDDVAGVAGVAGVGGS